MYIFFLENILHAILFSFLLLNEIKIINHAPIIFQASYFQEKIIQKIKFERRKKQKL
jgi:hypothetical protein